jgi:hypothetical protein
MKRNTITTMIASALAALSIGLAAPAFAAPSGPGDNSGSDGSSVVQDGNKAVPNDKVTPWLGNAGMTPYGTYQNAHADH